MRCCREFISGRQIEVLENGSAGCPSENCPAAADEWVYPNEVAPSLNRWGRRALRMVNKAGAKLLPIPAV